MRYRVSDDHRRVVARWDVHGVRRLLDSRVCDFTVTFQAALVNAAWCRECTERVQ
jgi:hypothetical protein